LDKQALVSHVACDTSATSKFRRYASYSAGLPEALPLDSVNKKQGTKAMTTKHYKTKIIHVRLSEQEYETLLFKINASGLTISEFIRRAANNRRITSKIEANVVNELRRIGGLLKHVHNESNGAYSSDTASAIFEIREAVKHLSQLSVS